MHAVYLFSDRCLSGFSDRLFRAQRLWGDARSRGDAPRVARRLPLAIIFRAVGAVTRDIRASENKADGPLAIVLHAVGAASVNGVEHCDTLLGSRS
jgi:hypothetical protein